MEKSRSDSIHIGNQVWMTSNLDVTSFRNGEPIPQVQDLRQWVLQDTAAMCNYEGVPCYCQRFGYLYNWHAVNDLRGLAPKGWRIPDEEDWKILIDFLGGDYSAVSSLKEKGNGSARSDYSGSNSRFSALPGGIRSMHGDFRFFDTQACFWSRSLHDRRFAKILGLNYSANNVHFGSAPFRSALSVRCIKE